MSYNDSGFNDFLDRSIGADPRSTTLATLPVINNRSINFDQLQVNGSVGNTIQLGGSIQGGTLKRNETKDGTLRNLELQGNLTLKGKLIIGNNTFVIDGSTIQMVVKDENGVERILLGKLVGGF